MTLRVGGLVVGLLLVLIGLVGRRRGRFSRGDFVVWATFGLAVAVLSITPGVADSLRDVLRLENRLFAVLVAAVGALSVLLQRQRILFRGLETKFGDLVRNLAVRDFRAEGQPGCHG